MTGKSVLVVVAHADDEVLGCGGCIVSHSLAGDLVNILILADGVTSRDSGRDVNLRKSAARKAALILGANPPQFMDFPDNALDTVPLLEIIKVIEQVISGVQPELIYTHHGGDLNIDHSITQRAVMTACRPYPGQTVKNVYGFEILSSTEWGNQETSHVFRPTHFVIVDKYLDRKIEAIKCYEDELRPYPHARSIETIEALAKLRGSQVGFKAAEAFSVFRQIRIT